LDEFPNLILENKALLSKFQKIWDEILKNTTIKLIFCGSSISIMENYLLDRKKPAVWKKYRTVIHNATKSSTNTEVWHSLN
jgi:AAA+ ATPase superfamily predicted ATPase